MKKLLQLVVAGLLLSACGSGSSSAPKESEKSSSTAPEVKQEKKWTEVYKFTGNGKKKSPNFDLTGNDAKVTYKYTAPGNMGGAGMFALYVVDKGKDIMKEGGIPEVMVSKSEESESAIQKSA